MVPGPGGERRGRIPPDAEEGLVRLDAELENLRRAIGWARDHDGPVEVELLGAAWWFLYMRGLFREALNYLEHALETARSTSLDQAELLRGAGTVARTLGDLTATQQWTEELLELGRARGDARAIAGSLATLASVAVQGGDLERARTLLLDADDAARAYGDMNMSMYVAHLHGEIDLEAGDARGRASTTKKRSNWRASYETHGASQSRWSACPWWRFSRATLTTLPLASTAPCGSRTLSEKARGSSNACWDWPRSPCNEVSWPAPPDCSEQPMRFARRSGMTPGRTDASSTSGS